MNNKLNSLNMISDKIYKKSYNYNREKNKT